MLEDGMVLQTPRKCKVLALLHLAFLRFLIKHKLVTLQKPHEKN